MTSADVARLEFIAETLGELKKLSASEPFLIYLIGMAELECKHLLEKPRSRPDFEKHVRLMQASI